MSDQSVFKRLWEAAQLQLPKAYCNYSNFPVTAAIQMQNGDIYTGINIENSSYSLTLCAESNAISKAICDKYQLITHVLVYAPKLEYCSPCGACRQKIFEFSNPNTIIFLCKDSENYKTLSIGELLPASFHL